MMFGDLRELQDLVFRAYVRHVMLFATFPTTSRRKCAAPVLRTQRQSDDRIVLLTDAKTTGG